MLKGLTSLWIEAMPFWALDSKLSLILFINLAEYLYPFFEDRKTIMSIFLSIFIPLLALQALESDFITF